MSSTNSTTRITVAQVAAQVAAQGDAITQIASAVTALTQALTNGQFATSAAVVSEIADAPSKRKAAKKSAAKPAPAKAKAAMPESLGNRFALLRDTKPAMSPLNKALAAADRANGRKWVKAIERPKAQIDAALNTLTAAERKAAKAALVRLSA